LKCVNENIQNDHSKNLQDIDESIVEKSSIISIPSTSHSGLNYVTNTSVDVNSNTNTDTDNDSRRPSLLYLTSKMTSEEIDEVENEMKDLYSKLQTDLINHFNYNHNIQSNWQIQESLNSNETIQPITASTLSGNNNELIISIQSNDINSREMPRRPSLIQPNAILTKEEYDIQHREMEEQLRSLKLQTGYSVNDCNNKNYNDITIVPCVDLPGDKIKGSFLSISSPNGNINNEKEAIEMMRAMQMLQASCNDNNKNHHSNYDIASHCCEDGKNNENNKEISDDGNKTEAERIAMTNELQKLRKAHHNSNKAYDNILKTNDGTIELHEAIEQNNNISIDLNSKND